MGWPYVLLAVLVFAAIPAAVALLVYRLSGKPAKVLSGLLQAVAWWGLAYSLELSAGDLEGKVFWGSAKFVGSSRRRLSGWCSRFSTQDVIGC